MTRSPAIVRAIAVGALLGCSASHEPVRHCDPAAPEADCRSNERCNRTYEGIHVCMRTCDDVGALCETGEVCLFNREGRYATCWLGGPAALGEACERGGQCQPGLRCNRERVCQESCSVPELMCSTPGLVCEGSVCQRPVPTGAPCTYYGDCSPGHFCPATALFTCAPECNWLTMECPDGSSCDPSGEGCPLTYRPEEVDACERTSAGPVGCRVNEVCVLTTLGLRRCALECDPTDSFGFEECLPDPEDPSTYVQWPGGLIDRGQPCTSSHECTRGLACNADGVCG